MNRHDECTPPLQLLLLSRFHVKMWVTKSSFLADTLSLSFLEVQTIYGVHGHPESSDKMTSEVEAYDVLVVWRLLREDTEQLIYTKYMYDQFMQLIHF